MAMIKIIRGIWFSFILSRRSSILIDKVVYTDQERATHNFVTALLHIGIASGQFHVRTFCCQPCVRLIIGLFLYGFS